MHTEILIQNIIKCLGSLPKKIQGRGRLGGTVETKWVTS